MQTQTIQGPMHGLIHKWKALRRCRKCDHLMFVVFSSDGTYFGAHYSSICTQFPENESCWTCNECFGDKKEADKPAKKKGRMGFRI